MTVEKLVDYYFVLRRFALITKLISHEKTRITKICSLKTRELVGFFVSLEMCHVSLERYDVAWQMVVSVRRGGEVDTRW